MAAALASGPASAGDVARPLVLAIRSRRLLQHLAQPAAQRVAARQPDAHQTRLEQAEAHR